MKISIHSLKLSAVFGLALVSSAMAGDKPGDPTPKPVYHPSPTPKPGYPAYNPKAGKSVASPKGGSEGGSPKATKAGKGTPKPTPKPTPACNENGYEVWKVQPNENFGLKLKTTVDTNECTYELELSFKPDESLPFLSGPTADDLIGTPQEEYDSICAAEGFDETQTPSILSPADHVGLNTYYTDYATSIELSERAAGKVGFKLATLGASPCGTFLQPFPQYSIHFYTIDTAGRKELKCFSDGGYFCKTIDEQCTDSGRKMNMDIGGPLCAVQKPGFPQFENLPPGYAWTTDGNAAVGVNAATPAMGLHAVDPDEFLPDRDVKIPYLLQLNYDQQVIGNHILLWSGFAKGEGLSVDYEKPTPDYSCQTADRTFLPTNTQAKYNEDTGRTSVIITGPLKDCTGESFTEVLY